jgi:hypothetical protein
VWLRETTESIKEIRIPLDATDSDICNMAQQQAAEVMALASMAHGVGELRYKAAEYVQRWGIEPPGLEYLDRPAIARMTDELWWRRKLRTVHGRLVEENAIALARVHKRREIYASDVTVKQREQQKRRNLKTLQETQARNMTTGQDFTLAELAEKAVSNPAIRRGELMVRLAGFEAVAKGLGHVGMFFTVTCPSRMHRMKTNERGTVFENAKWDKTTPKQAAGYLSKMWARVRAAWKREALAVYGFRIAEPHHDGTPHWHLLLFMAADVVGDVVGIFKRHAMAEDAAELFGRRARKARFDVKRIDPRKGSAAGYVAKYVSKNIDGFQVQMDLEGENLDAVTGSQRVEAWASRWGIRQFQQIGGPPVGVWRELRRLPKDGAYTATVETARAATDKTSERQADWAGYVGVMGLERFTVKSMDLSGYEEDENGQWVKPVEWRWSKPSKHGVTRPLPLKVKWKTARHWPIEIAKVKAGERCNPATGEFYPVPETRYGDEPGEVVYGVRDVSRDKGYMTRIYKWEIRRGYAGKNVVGIKRGTDSENGGAVGAGLGSLGMVSPVVAGGLGNTQSEAGARGCGNGRTPAVEGFSGNGEADATWSPVNNCTEGVKGGNEDSKDSAVKGSAGKGESHGPCPGGSGDAAGSGGAGRVRTAGRGGLSVPDHPRP